MVSTFFFFNDTATTEIYTLSLHDALPISPGWQGHAMTLDTALSQSPDLKRAYEDRKSTRLNSSHTVISYAVFCLKKKTLKPTMNIWWAHSLISTNAMQTAATNMTATSKKP